MTVTFNSSIAGILRGSHAKTQRRKGGKPYVPISIETLCPNRLVYRAKGAMDIGT